MHTTPHSQETKKLISLHRMGKMLGNDNPSWKGNAVKYRAIHMWVAQHRGKAKKCSNNPNHISTRYHWANISGEYKRDLEDFRELCPKCNVREYWANKKGESLAAFV